MAAFLYRSEHLREWTAFGCTLVSTACTLALSIDRVSLSHFTTTVWQGIGSSGILTFAAIVMAIGVLRFAAPYLVIGARLARFTLDDIRVRTADAARQGWIALARRIAPLAPETPLVIALPDPMAGQDIQRMLPRRANDSIYGIWSPWTSVDAPGKSLAA
ncbi:MAG: hypothetical protein V4574_20530 [Pseudomonadota bacterium]